MTPALAAKVASIPGLETVTAGAKLTADHLAAYASYLSNQWWFFPLKNPCIFTMTGAFLVGIIVSLLAPERSAQEGFSEVERRAVLGEPRGAAAE